MYAVGRIGTFRGVQCSTGKDPESAPAADPYVPGHAGGAASHDIRTGIEHMASGFIRIVVFQTFSVSFRQ
jgi:hypothetical protein